MHKQRITVDDLSGYSLAGCIVGDGRNSIYVEVVWNHLGEINTYYEVYDNSRKVGNRLVTTSSNLRDALDYFNKMPP